MRINEHLGSAIAIAGTLLCVGACIPFDAVERGGTAAQAGEDGFGIIGSATLPAGQMTAGEWRDLDDWDFWLGLFDVAQTLNADEFEALLAGWDMTPLERIPVQIETDGTPVVDIPVTLFDEEGKILWQARTDNRGHAELFTDRRPIPTGDPLGELVQEGIEEASESRRYLLEIEGVDKSATINSIPTVRKRINISASDAPQDSSLVDLMLVMDTTGSMQDELSYFQAELNDVLERVERRVDGDLELRMSVNFYRDEGDEYVVRPFPFKSPSRARSNLRDQTAGGGGDYEEAVAQALDNAINDHEWSPNARARLMLLVLDAPPHRDPRTLQRLDKLVREAAAKGIRIIPVSGSGVLLDSEMLCRHINALTGGTYVFITNDSGIGDSHLAPTVGEYKVRPLNDLLVEIFLRYMDKRKAITENFAL